jgi:hypothetical protein
MVRTRGAADARAMRRRLVRVLPFAAVLAGLLAPAAGAVTAETASAACATRTTASISGTVYGQDGRDVNASVGFDVLDRAGTPLNTDPSRADYGCAKAGGYSVPQTYVNHFVGYQGAQPGTVMKDGTRTTRAFRLGTLPSNAHTVWIEAYSRGYQGSPCKDSKGNWCFNPTDVRKYGYANLIKIPVGTQGIRVVLPTTCGFRGTAGSIVGKGIDAAGRPVTLKQVYAWTEASWNAAPGVHGWAAHKPTTPTYALRSLAAGQRYVVWAYGPRGNKVVTKNVLVRPCASTPLTIRV